ncbi:MAG: acyl--CoA ligase [Oscillospiraceae bacterium]|nr:acyl--CoA ligase [Oscillospiraceae bacterium]
MSQITEAFRGVCAANSTQTAVIYREGKKVLRKSFGELWNDVLQMCSYYKEHGAEKGERILAFSEASYPLCVGMIAALLCGTPIMYVDIRVKQEKLRNIFQQYHPDMVLVSARTKWLRPFFREIGKIKKVLHVEQYENVQPMQLDCDYADEDAVALLTMTTGSTGMPKTAIRTHQDLLHQLQLVNANLDTDVHETVLTTSFIYVFANMLNGFTTVIPRVHYSKFGNSKMKRHLKLFSQESISMMITSPDICLGMEQCFPGLSRVYLGGAILNLNEAMRIQKKFSGCQCTTIYGSTECNLIASVSLDEYIAELQQSGKAMLGHVVTGVQVRLTDKKEVLVSGDALLAHYLGKDSGKELDASGRLWHHTGDMAEWMDDKLYYLGKEGRCIRYNDKLIYYNELEQAIIRKYCEIQKCAVLQKKDTVYVFLQGNPVLQKTVAQMMEKYGFTKTKVLTLRKIPCDVKHHTKIDYHRLEEKLKWLHME